ncbi:MAG: M6 family metalloprotease domain-containing protein [Verrucomicrobia bacterium]|nr:M6 family metalloprotease domain-containing protein [Verrucomicrobiota bacterium]
MAPANLRRILVLIVLAAGPPVRAAEAPSDLSGYRTVRDTITARIAPPVAAAGLSGYLGVHFETDAKGKLLIGEVGADSPAAKAGVQAGDVLVKLGGKSVKSADEARSFLQSRPPGATLKISVQRGRKSLDLTATLGAVSKPMKIGEERAIIGVRMGTGSESAGIPIISVTTNKPAAKAGLKSGDVILKAAGKELSESLSISDALAEHKPGDTVEFLVRRAEDEFTKKLQLAADDTGVPEEQRALKPWKKDVFRIGVILVEFPDVKHNDDVAPRDWSESYFSRGTYTKTNALGVPVHGSMNDYYREQSCGALRIEGKVFDWVETRKKRGDYNVGTSVTNKAAFFNEAVDLVLKREGRDALKNFDGLAFIYAGGKFPTQNRGSLFWPHRSSFSRKGKLWSYVIVAEGGAKMGNISVMCHETGHSLGLPDLYARPENPGSEGAGVWCAMSTQGRDGRPEHFSAWCKEQLGWIKPVVLDPAVKQKLILGPMEGATNECFKILARPDGSEYFLLENRRKKGFDASLPAEGLLIWRVIGNRPILEESHGVQGPAGPRVYLGSVPFPSKANHSFTPYTTPSSRSQLGGGAPVFVTNIRQLGDGRIAFEIGYEFD